MRRDREREREREREKEQFMTAVSTHIQSTESADVGGEWWVQAERRTSLFCRCV